MGYIGREGGGGGGGGGGGVFSNVEVTALFGHLDQ